MRKIFVLALATVFISGCAHAQITHSQAPHSAASQSTLSIEVAPHMRAHADYQPYNLKANSMVEIDKALAKARRRGTKTVVVMGANWCPDSRALAARLDKPEFQSLIQKSYELVYVSTGNKPGQKDQNRAVSKRFGVDAIVGTPTVFIVTPDGKVLNPGSAGYWRHAESIPSDMSYAYFEMYAGK